MLLAFFVLLPPLSWAEEEQRAFKVINAVNGLADNSAQIVKCTRSGRLIISTIGNLNFYDGKTFSHADVNAIYEYRLPLYRGHYHLYFDREHHIWLKDKLKVTVLDLTTESFIVNVDSVIRLMGCLEPVLDLFADQFNQMWFLTNQGLYSPQYQRMFNVLRDTNRNLQDVDVCKDVVYSFYDDGEVVGHDTLGNVVCHTAAYDWGTGKNYAASSVLQPYGDGFFQIRNGDAGAILLYFDAKTNTFSELMRTDYHLNNMVPNAYNGNIYIPCEYGYWVYNPLTSEKEHVPLLRLTDGSMLNTDCNTIAFDNQGGMWIGTEKRGVLYARPHSLLFRAYTWADEEALQYDEMMADLERQSLLPDVAISEYNGMRANCKFVDSRGWTWIGTRMGIYFNRPGQEEVVFTRRQGMNNDVIHSIIEDQDHNIWTATSCGVTFFLVHDGDVVFINNFMEDDNVPNESFDNCKAIMLPDGTIVMKAIEHVLAFNPSELHEVNQPHLLTNIKPKLVMLLVNGNIIEPCVPYQDNVIIDKAYPQVKHINLQSDQNSVSMVFSALNYFRPLQTYYRVRIAELGNDWEVHSYRISDLIDDVGMLHLPLANLKPGDYHIEVQSSMFPNVWDEHISEDDRNIWEIHVKQPWWRTTGLLFLFATVLFALLIVNFFFFNRNSRMRDRRNAEEGDIIRKIRFFVERCNAYDGQQLKPEEEVNTAVRTMDTPANKLTPEFTKLMLKLLPYVSKNQDRMLTMQKLSREGQVDIVKLYGIVTDNLYKNPRELVMANRLHKGAELLVTTDMTVEQVAMECGFYTPNYFIGNFFHLYKLTPEEYRKKKKK